MILQKIGIHSLPIFGLHIPVIGFWKQQLSSIPLIHNTYIMGVIIVSLTIVVMYPFALILDKLLKKLIRPVLLKM